MKKTDEFYLKQEEPVKSCLLVLKDIILEFNTNIVENWKYNMPCFVYNDKALCYLWIDKDQNLPYILMVDGNKIDSPFLKQGSRKRMKVFYVFPDEDIPIAEIKKVLIQGVEILNG